MSTSPKVNYQYSTRLEILFLSFCIFLGIVASLPASGSVSGAPAKISYQSRATGNRALIFSNNPEYLWNTKDICDLADESRNTDDAECGNTLFHIESLRNGNYRVWWEHRNMMPFIIQSALVFENKATAAAVIEVEGIHVETNSKKNGGREFVALLNSGEAKPKVLKIEPGERVVLQDSDNRRIFPGHYFAGVSDLTVVSGTVSLSEVVFRRHIARELRNSHYDQRDNFGVRESLVYKGISPVSSVELTGAVFTIDDSTSNGLLPVAYKPAQVVSDSGYCQTNQLPACSGQAIAKSSEPSEFSSWVTHIAPDPADSNPKRTFAIVDDLVSLILPASLENCPSIWPMSLEIAQRHCLVMSPYLRWFLRDVQNWRLPNWGNWAVQYHHPVTVTNSGEIERLVKIVVTADGESPIAFRGTGVTEKWKQYFLTDRASNNSRKMLTLAQAVILPGSTVTLEAELILAGPAAGTLQHHIELSN
ncbi:MAG: hypothetical protein RJB13_1890 [Pseudomonadota bacterium]